MSNVHSILYILRNLRNNVRRMRKSSILNALFLHSRQNLLATLIPQSERRWYLSDLARHLQVSPSSLQRELASLTAAGVLRREEDGNRVYYQADPTFPLLPELRSIFAKTTGAIPLLAEVIEAFEDRIALAFVFGSYARGEQTGRSDVDLMLVGNAANLSLAELSLPLRGVEKAIGVEVNMTLYSPEELREKWQGGNHFVRTVLEGQKIFLKGTEDALADLVGERAGAGASDEQAGVG